MTASTPWLAALDVVDSLVAAVHAPRLGDVSAEPAAALLLRVASASAYLPLAGVDLALCALGLLLYRKRWAAPEYSFFWGKAMSW